MKYFKNVKSAEELKTTYKKLARQNHPDFGGDVEVMKIINNEFDMLCHVLPERIEKTATQHVLSFIHRMDGKVLIMTATFHLKKLLLRLETSVRKCILNVSFL